MKEEEYIKTRLGTEINWHVAKCNSNKNWFNGLRLVQFVSAAIIPFLAGFTPNLPHNSIVVGVLGVIIAVATGLMALNKYHENWIEYRKTAERLKHEKYLFQTKCGCYEKDKPFKLLVMRVESILSKENSQWAKYIDNNEVV